MPPLRGLGLSICIVFLVVLHVTCAVKLQTPHQHDHITIGVPFHVSWTSESGPNDPSTLNITLSCNSNTTILDGSVPILSKSADVNIQSWEIQNSSFPLSCNLQARATNSTLLDGVTIEVTNSTSTNSQPLPIPTNSPGITTTLSSTSSTTLSSDPTKTSLSMNTTLSESTQTSASSLTTALPPGSTASSPQTSKPIGAIIGGVVGGLVALGILAILVTVYLRRRCRSPPTPRPLPYDQNYVQPLDKSGQLAQLANEREAVRRQRDQLQTEVESMHLRESDHDETSNSGVLERKIEALSQRIFELERQLYDDQSPPSYSNLSSSL